MKLHAVALLLAEEVTEASVLPYEVVRPAGESVDDVQTLTGNVERDDPVAAKIGSVIDGEERVVRERGGLEDQSASRSVGSRQFGSRCPACVASVAECIPRC